MPHLGFGLLVTALLILVFHWFPLSRGLPRLVAYVLGCLAIIAGIVVWLAALEWLDILPYICAFFVVAGLATGAGYGIDYGLQRWRVWQIEHGVVNGRRAR